jgi:uncharacterized MAPEG superfamily protein
MTRDLWMLIDTALLYFFLVFVYSFGRWVAPGGFKWAFGNRETLLNVHPWVSRAVRSQQNLTENLVPFAILVLTAHATGRIGDATDLGATIFFASRCAHAFVYIMGVTYLRSVLWVASLGGELLILAQFFR